MQTDKRDVIYACRLIEHEVLRAITLFPAMNSGHEGKAVIEEEFDELWEEVKRNALRSTPAMGEEAVHLGAMVARFIADVCLRDDGTRAALAQEKPG